MSISRCIVRLKDCHDTEHSVEGYAESLYEAVLNTVEVVMLSYTLIHGCDPAKYKASEIVEILRPDPGAGEWWMKTRELRAKICQKKSGWRPS